MIKTLSLASSLSSSVMGIILAATALTALSACNNVSPTLQSTATSTVVKPAMQSAAQAQTTLSPAVQVALGDYVSAGYAQRAQGYDWVAVMISANGSEAINIKVRARTDIKQASCSYEGQATLMGQDNAHGIIFQTIANDSLVFLQFKDGQLTIDSEDKRALNYFCSGGATLAGDYQKLTGSLAVS